MIVSWNWLGDYLPLPMPVGELTDRLTMTGLNLENVTEIDGDRSIDLEVTSNRPDCLGHIGIAREAAVLFQQELRIPAAEPRTTGEKTESATSVRIEVEDLCPRYIARVIRGVKIGPSPEWLRKRLQAVGVAAINNVVDVTNYVLLECGQPLHAFDLDKLGGRRIVVRRARAGETIRAIDQRDYKLDPEMCVIADAERPVAIGGVMGGFETEIGDATTNVLIEVADFSPLSIRNTARKLNLHSPSSYRFERGIDAAQMDWASRRCCELILQTAGGELLDGAVIAGTLPTGERPPIPLRFAQLRRLLGIDVPRNAAVRILTDLGLQLAGEASEDESLFVPPSWRRDLSREADLIEEVARIYGYDKIPDDVPVPLSLSSKSHGERVVDRVRDVLTAAGFYEAVTLSFVSEEQNGLFTPRGDRPRLAVEHSSRRHENVLRQSLIPSLLQSRRENERHGVFNAQLFEIARVYLEAAPGQPEARVEPATIGLVSGLAFADLKGVVEGLARRLNREASVTVQPSGVPQFTPGRGAEVFLNGTLWGWMGELSRETIDRIDLRDPVSVAELDLGILSAAANLAPTYRELPQYPAIERDLNFVLDEPVTWQRLEALVRETAGPLLERVGFGGQYRGQQIGPGKKSYLVTLTYRSSRRTLESAEVDQIQQAIVDACGEKLGGALR